MCHTKSNAELKKWSSPQWAVLCEFSQNIRRAEEESERLEKCNMFVLLLWHFSRKSLRNGEKGHIDMNGPEQYDCNSGSGGFTFSSIHLD